MASSNKTDKLQLPQWQLNEKPEMEDFNNAFDKIEDFKDEFDTHKADNANKAHGGAKGALVALTINQSIPASVMTPISWNLKQYDTLNLYNSANPTRFVIPNGVSKIRLNGNVRWADMGYKTDALLLMCFTKNNSNNFVGNAVERKFPSGRCETNLVSSIVNVIEGDYFNLMAYQNTGSAMNVEGIAGQCWFGIEVIE